MYKSYSLYGQAMLGDVVVAHAMVANFLSRYLSTSRSNDRKEVNSRTFRPRRSSSASKAALFCS